MKKPFIALLTALAFAGTAFAQDDDEYEEVIYEEVDESEIGEDDEVVYEEVEEDEAPAKAEKKAEPKKAAAKKKEEKPKKEKKPVVPYENGMLGIGAEVTGLDAIRVVYNFSSTLGFVGVLSYVYDGEKVEYPAADGGTTTVDNNGWGLGIALGAIYTIYTPLLPVFIDGEVSFGTTTADHTYIGFEAYFGAKATLIKSLELAGQAGFAFEHAWWEDGDYDWTNNDFGLKTKVYLTWYFL